MKKVPIFEHHYITPLLQFHEIIDAGWILYDLLYIGIYFHLIIVHPMAMRVKSFFKQLYSVSKSTLIIFAFHVTDYP